MGRSVVIAKHTVSEDDCTSFFVPLTKESPVSNVVTYDSESERNATESVHRSRDQQQQRTMKRLSSLDVRRTFLNFFKDRHKHVIVPTSSVIPSTNQGTYFANSGMCQFVPVFLGQREAEKLYGSRRVASCQRCIRVGGKHNDLDDVGKDDYHHTFFEMLGNWSFGSYSKVSRCNAISHVYASQV